jgi:hypothetical protein
VQEIADFEKELGIKFTEFKTKCAKHRRKQYFYGQNKYSKPNPTMRWMELN